MTQSFQTALAFVTAQVIARLPEATVIEQIDFVRCEDNQNDMMAYLYLEGDEQNDDQNCLWTSFSIDDEFDDEDEYQLKELLLAAASLSMHTVLH